MSPNIVVGRAPTLGPRATGTAGDLLTSRFQVVSGTQLIEGSAYVLWDADPVWNDLGLADDWTLGSFFFTEPGEYLIVAYTRVGPASSADPGTGTALIAILTGGSGDPLDFVDEQMSAPFSVDTSSNLAVSGVHRFYVGGSFQISIHLFDVESMTVTAASVSITKLRSIPAL